MVKLIRYNIRSDGTRIPREEAKGKSITITDGFKWEIGTQKGLLPVSRKDYYKDHPDCQSLEYKDNTLTIDIPASLCSVVISGISKEVANQISEYATGEEVA